MKVVGKSLNDLTLSVDQRFQDDGQRIDKNIGTINTINSRIDTVESYANELENSLKVRVHHSKMYCMHFTK